jgi:hypothetical protein
VTLQEQLGQSQQAPSTFPYLLVFAVAVQAGVLGNQSVQTPAKLVGAGQAIRRADTPTAVAAIAAPESAEMGWLVRNAQELGQHKGEWLLIQGMQLLVHSRDFAAVRAAIRERQIGSPFVYYVPTDDESNSVTI